MVSSGLFQAFTITFKGTADRIITNVHLSVAFDPTNPPNPAPPMLPTTALWDTGATRSVISSGMVSALGLRPTGTTNVNHAGGASVSNTYVVNFGLPNQVGVAGILVTEFSAITGGFGAIVGMDIISHGDLSLTNVSGQTCMSFRIPSCDRIDYVVEANKFKFSGVPRNAPCPCGKKRPAGGPMKFKHCHGSTSPP